MAISFLGVAILYGGPYGGIAEIDFDDKGKLKFLGTNCVVEGYFSEDGTLRVSKFGLWAERTLSNIRKVSDGVKRCDIE